MSWLDCCMCAVAGRTAAWVDNCAHVLMGAVLLATPGNHCVLDVITALPAEDSLSRCVCCPLAGFCAKATVGGG